MVVGRGPTRSWATIGPLWPTVTWRLGSLPTIPTITARAWTLCEMGKVDRALDDWTAAIEADAGMALSGAGRVRGGRG